MSPSRSGKGRVAIVFETRSGMRVAATMPDPGRSEDRRSLEYGQGQTPARRADGPSACPGDSSHERGRVSASDNPWDMQQAAKSIRVRNAGEDLLPRPGSAQRSSALGWTTARVPRKRHAGCRIQTMRAPRARVLAQPFRTPLRAKEGNRRPAAPGRTKNRGDDAACSPDEAKRNPGSCRGSQLPDFAALHPGYEDRAAV